MMKVFKSAFVAALALCSLGVWAGSGNYTVHYGSGGGSGSMPDQTCVYDSVYSLSTNKFTNGGKKFDGWWCEQTGRRYDPDMLIFNLTNQGETVTMTAVWDGALGGVQLWENGPYWAECNVGATKPEEYGYYFWWGDTVGYKRNANDDGWESVKDGSSYSFNGCPTYMKDNSELQSAGYIDAPGNLVAAHDAATVHLGAPWRMPTAEEIDALINNCDTELTTRNGVYGLLVKGRGAYSSRSIFLPAAGYGGGSSLNAAGSIGNYWSSTPTSDDSGDAWYLDFYSGYFKRDDYYRFFGQSVRPVR